MPAATAIVGESLAGLFVVETFLLGPALFDPSLWWNDQSLLAQLDGLLDARPERHAALFLANSEQAEIAELTARLAQRLAAASVPGLRLHHAPEPASR